MKLGSDNVSPPFLLSNKVYYFAFLTVLNLSFKNIVGSLTHLLASPPLMHSGLSDIVSKFYIVVLSYLGIPLKVFPIAIHWFADFIPTNADFNYPCLKGSD